MQHITRALYLLSALRERCWRWEKWPTMKGNMEVTHPFLLHRNKENADFSLLQIGPACKCCMPSAPKWTPWSSPWSPHFLWCVNHAKEQDCTISCVVFFLHSISWFDIKCTDSAHLGTSTIFLQPCRSVVQKGPAMHYEEFGEFIALLKTVCSAVLPQSGSMPVLSPVMLRNCSLDLFSNNPTPLFNYEITGWWPRLLAEGHWPWLTPLI